MTSINTTKVCWITWKDSEIILRIGIIWTYVNIKKNWDHYRSYPSVVTQSRLQVIMWCHIVKSPILSFFDLCKLVKAWWGERSYVSENSCLLEFSTFCRKIEVKLKNSAEDPYQLFRRFYPEIDDKRIMQFYGVSGMAMTKELWNKLVISKLVSKIGQPWKAGLPKF